MIKRWVGGASLVAALILPMATACASTLSGQVLDAETGSPVVGAIVLGVWTEKVGLPGLHSTKLIDVREVETDAQGRFELPRPRPAFHEDGESITIYKPGYVAWNNLFVFPTSKRRVTTDVPKAVRLERFQKGQNRQKHLEFVNDARFALLYDDRRVPSIAKALKQEERR